MRTHSTIKIIALILAIALLMLLGSPTFDRITIIMAVIFLSGRALVDIMLSAGVRGQKEDLGRLSPNYLAVAAGPALVLVATCLLRGIHLYSFPAMMTLLAIFILAAAAGCSEFRKFILPGDVSLNPFLAVYLACVASLWIMFRDQEYPYLHATAVYLTQGFDLFFHKDPAEWPYFGEKYVMPLMYVTHVIGANFALLSSGDHFEFYRHGLYWLNILLAPIVPIGAYLFFRRSLPWWAAIPASLLFCWSALDWKVWSIRGETLGWIFGFAFLITFIDLLDIIKERGVTRGALRLTLLLSLIFFALALTHGVVAMIVSFLSAGFVLSFLFSAKRGDRRFIALLKLGAVFSIGAVLLSIVYVYTFSGKLKSENVTANYDLPPQPNEKDAALLFESAIMYPMKFNIPAVRPAPPLIDTKTAVQMTAFLPPASLFRIGLANIAVRYFPDQAINNLKVLSRREKFLYIFLLSASCFLFIFRLFLEPVDRKHSLFWGAVSVYVLLIGFSIYLNYSSVSTFPFAAIRRSYVYVRFFYWLALALAFYSFVHHLLRFLAGQNIKKLLSGFKIASPYLEGAVFTIALSFLVISSVTHWAGREASFSSFWERIKERTASKLGRIMPITASLTANVRGEETPREQALIEAVGYIRDHTAPGEWIFSNVISDNQFCYLSSGRYSLLEGSAMYQVYSLQGRAATRINKFTDFVVNADQSILSGYGVHYILLYRHCQCDSYSCYGFNVLPTSERSFASNEGYERVFENSDFAIFRVVEGRAPVTGAPTRFVPDCSYDPIPRYVAALSEGILLSRPGFPTYIADVTGMSICEKWGRWSEGEETAFRFRIPLPGVFDLVVQANAFGPNNGMPIIVSVGNVTKSFIITGFGRTYRIRFKTQGNADSIKFEIPRPISPADLDPRNGDLRKIGIGFIMLKIEPKDGNHDMRQPPPRLNRNKACLTPEERPWG